MICQRVRVGAVVGVPMGAITVGMAAPGAAHAAQAGQARRVAALASAESLNATEARYQVKGTDLGILWTDEARSDQPGNQPGHRPLRSERAWSP